MVIFTHIIQPDDDELYFPSLIISSLIDLFTDYESTSEKENPMSPEKKQIDPLTGLLSRKAFNEQFRAVMEISRKTDRPAVLIFLDIDHFLNVNETYSHQAGDAVIAGIAGMARQAFGGEAILGRFGGDETAILLPGVEREAAFLTLERLRQA